MTRGRHILSTPAIAQGERLCRGRRTSRAYGPWGLLSVVLIFGLLSDLYTWSTMPPAPSGELYLDHSYGQE